MINDNKGITLCRSGLIAATDSNRRAKIALMAALKMFQTLSIMRQEIMKHDKAGNMGVNLHGLGGNNPKVSFALINVSPVHRENPIEGITGKFQER